MATQITCIVRDGRDPDNRIDSVGGPGWTSAEDTVIREIESGSETYFVEVSGQEAAVEVGVLNGRKFLRTAADATTENNLLSLPECP